MKYKIRACSLGIALICFSGCKKLVQVAPPTTELVGTSVYNTSSTAAAAVNGIYLTMAGNSIGGNGQTGISALLGLSADEFNLYPNSDIILNQAYTNALTSANPAPEWSDLYNCIYQANSAIEGISASTGLSSALKQQLMGEAEFIRAFCHFYLVNIYGNVPLVTTSNYQVNEVISSSPQAEVYQQIIADLNAAQNLLGNSYFTPGGAITAERVRPNMGAASALLARVYLYQGKWDSAEAAATAVINNTNYQLLNSLDSVFLASSNEAIWQLELPDNGFNTPDASAFLVSFIYFGGPSSIGPFILNDSLVNIFEPGDLRRLDWVDSSIVGSVTYYYPYKYKLDYTGAPPAEFPVLLRLAEQYLIRAEARAQQNNLIGSAADLNKIRVRAGLPPTSAITQRDLLSAIYKERRVELFTEYGHRWLDIKRIDSINQVMSIVTPEKGGTWQTTDQLYPIPLSEIKADPNLAQNPGYN